MPPKKTPAKKKPQPNRKTAAGKPSQASKTSKSTKSTKSTETTKPSGRPRPKTPAAKKPAPKVAAAGRAKAPAKKQAPTKQTEPRSTPASTGGDGPGRSSKPKIPFKVGDKVVYPHHGAATIIRRERIDFDGAKHEYFVLEVATDQLTVRVPAARALDLGVRPVISKNMARKVFQTFREEPQEAGANWSRWYKLLTEKINSGDIFQVAEVVRDLTYAQQIKGISPALKRMLAKARLIIVSELRFALQLEEDEAIKRLDRSLPKVDEPVEAV
ncbi:MAG TPA: CarD family transcriptional regulator [Acidimicrobiia bacterium]